MKKIIFIVSISFSTLVLQAQKDTSFYKHEVKISYGINSLPNGIRMYEKDIWKGGFTANYMYRVKRWFWVGVNINWQFPSDIQYYSWIEYYTDGTFKDFEISKRDNFFAIAPELRFSYMNFKWVTLYSGLSAGYGIHTGINKKNLSSNFIYDYWYWHVTCFGANFHIGKKRNVFMGGELGVGFKGSIIVHVGYRF